MSELSFTDGGRALTATVSGAHQDPQTRAKTVRLTIADEAGAVLWRDMIRCKPLSAAFLQGLLTDEAGVALADDEAARLLALIFEA